MTRSPRRALLEAAARDAELLALVPPVVAAGFGVLPLRRSGALLRVACFGHANRQALRLLREVLQLDIIASAFDERDLVDAIQAAYFKTDESVNFPTFLEPDFLDDPGSAAVLREEKVEVTGPVVRELPAGQLALATLSYATVLENLDGPRGGAALPEPRRTRVQLGELDLGWRVAPDETVVYLPPGGELPPSASAVLTEFRTSEYRQAPGGGRMSEHEVRRAAVDALPYVIHPTEVQLLGFAGDGTPVIHAYDRSRTLRAGEALEVAYHFLSYGSRLRRRIRLVLEELKVVAREQVRVVSGAGPSWGPRELGLWFGLERAGRE